MKYTSEVMAIVPVTASPYADASAPELLNTSTSARHPIASSQFISGM